MSFVHSPDVIEGAEESGVDPYVCGYTHGVQVCFPGGVPVEDLVRFAVRAGIDIAVRDPQPRRNCS